MDQIKANYDRVLLIAVGLLLLAVALYAALGLSSVQEEFPAPDVRPSGEAFEPDAALASLQAEAAKVHDASGTVWSEQASSLFVSRRYLLSEGNLIDIEESGTQLVPGIDNDWILKHDLDYTDRNLAEADADRDGFTNLEEFTAGTIPKDAASKPPHWTKLRLKSFEKIPFRIKFMGAPSVRSGEEFKRGSIELCDGTKIEGKILSVDKENVLMKVQTSLGIREEKSYQLSKVKVNKEGKIQLQRGTEFSVNTLDYSSPTQFVEVGDKIAGTDLEVTQAVFKSAVNDVGTSVDTSELMVKDAATGDVIVLVAGREVDSPYSFALLVDTIRGEDIRVEKGKTFAFGPDGSSYKLIDVDSVAAVLEQVGSKGSSLKVPPLTTSAETPATDASIENTSNP